jgi:hypothetical protein
MRFTSLATGRDELVRLIDGHRPSLPIEACRLAFGF